MEQTGLLFMTPFINRPPTKKPAYRNCQNKWWESEHDNGKFEASTQVLLLLAPIKSSSLSSLHYTASIRTILWAWLGCYLEPWCMKPKQSRTLEKNVKYLLVPSPLRNRRTNFSTNLDVANKTPAPCNMNREEKRTGIEICLAPGGVPWELQKQQWIK